MTPDQIPDTHFVESEGRAHPLVVRHETGETEFAIVGGQLVPFVEYRSSRPAAPPAAAPQTFQVQDARFQGNILVS